MLSPLHLGLVLHTVEINTKKKINVLLYNLVTCVVEIAVGMETNVDVSQKLGLVQRYTVTGSSFFVVGYCVSHILTKP